MEEHFAFVAEDVRRCSVRDGGETTSGMYRGVRNGEIVRLESDVSDSIWITITAGVP